MYIFYIGDTALPVTPEKIEMKIGGNNKTINLINDGQVNILKLPTLTEITFDALIPSVEYPFSFYPGGSFVSPIDFLSKFENLKKNKEIFSFLIIRTKTDSLGFPSENTSMECSLEEYTIKEDADEGRDFVVSFKLKQYRHYGTKTLTINKTAGTATETQTRANNTAQAVTYTVQSGDSLWEIAKKKLGDGNRWKEIYNLNKDTIENKAKANGKASSKNGGLIYAGTVLNLPT